MNNKRKPKFRTNGWMYPFSPYQITALVLTAYSWLLLFGVELLITVEADRLWMYIFWGFIFICQVLSQYYVTSIIPDEDAVLAFKHIHPEKIRNADSFQGSRPIKSGHCFICQVKVGKRAKHCWKCNRCTATFDHHCVWLNNCIGSKNYSAFLVYTFTVLIGCIGMFIISSFILICETQNVTEFCSVPDVWWKKYESLKIAILVMIAIKVIILILATILTALLTLFHSFISFQNKTTYEFLKELNRL